MKGNHKYTIDIVKKYFEQRNCVLLSTQYKNPREKLEYIASCGHHHCISFDNFLKGNGKKCPKCSGKKWTICDVKSYFKDKGCLVLDDQYTPNKKIHYIAQCGHENFILLSQFKQGSGLKCPKCFGVKKYNIEEIKQYFKQNGCELLSTEYNGVFSKLHYIAQCGHENFITYDNFKNGKKGRMCPKCLGKNLTIEDVKKKFEHEGMTLLSTEYKNTRTPLKYIAQCGHEETTNLMLFNMGVGRKCKKCAYRKDVHYISDFFEKNNCKLLSLDYTGCKQKLKYIASCGHENETTWNQFQQGEARLCHACSRNIWTFDQVKKYFDDSGCTLLETQYTGSQQKLKYIAKCGHENVIDFEHFRLQNNGLYCPYCSNNMVTAKILFELLTNIFGKNNVLKEYVIHPNNIKYQLLDFYIPSEKLAVEYNGPQHYEKTWFHKTDAEFQYQLKRDEIKRQYCKDKNIRLIEIDGRKYNSKNIDENIIRVLLDCK